MAVFICKMCGGHMELIGGNVCECMYCLTKQTVPGFEGEQAQNMVNRANHCRQQCDFDKALELYEKVLAEYGEDVDVFWSLALSRYGIEYVDDPVTKAKTPTCHRMQYVSILEDSDYLKAIQVAAPEQKEVLVSEARKIAEIQKGILEITRNERPFDIFICYKETDEDGERTQDSVLAQDIYDALTREGYRVFFSRITLEGKLGVAYEPYIFSALNTSKVMIVVGTKPEYLESTWVKNEWGRYLQIVKKDSGKYIIPAYKGMGAYELPDALSIYQSQDMSKIGAIQDLVHGVKKLMAPAKQETQGAGMKEMSASFLKRAEMFLEERNWRSAKEYCEKALDADPSNDRAYLCMLLMDLKLTKKEQLQGGCVRFEKNVNYQRFMKVSVNEALKKEIKNYCDSVPQNIQKAKLRESHATAQNLMKRTKSVSAQKEAVRILEGMMPYVNVQEDLDKAKALLSTAKKKKRIGRLIGFVVVMCVIGAIIGAFYWLTKDYINGLVYTFQAQQLFNEGKYEDAIAKLEMIDVEIFQESTDDHILECINAMNMEKARALADGGNYFAAMELMQGMVENYRDDDLFREAATKCLETAKIGDTVYFGEKDFTVINGECSKPSYRFYEWEVFYNSYGEMLLISKESFGEYIFTDDDEGEFYSHSDLAESILPGVKNDLTEEEIEMIITTEIVDPDGSAYPQEFFILSIEEYEGIMEGRNYRVAAPEGDGYVDCWTRSTVTDEETGMICPIVVNKNGVSEVKKPSEMYHICPAVWISKPGYEDEAAQEGEATEGEE